MTPSYVDIDSVDVECEEYGGVGFLIEATPEGREPSYSVRVRPGRTNQSGEPRLTGWLGTTNNVARYARGLVRVGVRTPNDRCRLERLSDAEIRVALEALGFPELTPGT